MCRPCVRSLVLLLFVCLTVSVSLSVSFCCCLFARVSFCLSWCSGPLGNETAGGHLRASVSECLFFWFISILCMLMIDGCKLGSDIIDSICMMSALGASDRSVCDRLRLFFVSFLFPGFVFVACSLSCVCLVFLVFFSFSSLFVFFFSLSLFLSLNLFRALSLSLLLPQHAFSHREGLTAHLERM